MGKINWEKRRYELVKAAMSAMIINDRLLKVIAQKAIGCNQDWTETLSDNCLDLAEEMIKQLRKD